MTLTVKDIKGVFGMEYEVVSNMLKGLPDDYVFSDNDLICRSNYIAVKVWQKDDISTVLQDKGYDGTDEEVSAVLSRCGAELNNLKTCTEEDWEIIDLACEDAGFN